MHIDYEENIFSDSRWHKLLLKIGNHYTAKGMLVEAWFLAHRHWLKHRGVPKKHWPEDLQPLLDFNLAVERGDVIYVRGSKEKCAYLDQRSAAGKSKSKAKIDAVSKNLEKARAANTSLGKIDRNGENSENNENCDFPNTRLIENDKNPKRNTNGMERGQTTYTSTNTKNKTSIPNGMLPGRAKSASRETTGVFAMEDFGKIVTPEVGKRWESLYEREYVQRELVKILNWLAANPKKNKKTTRGWLQFVSNWLDRGWPAYQRSLKAQGVG